MELNSAVSSLIKIGAFGGKSQLREFQETQNLREHPGKSQRVEHVRHSHTQHAERLNVRLEQMSNMLARLQQSAPVLQEAAAFMVERSSGFSMSFAYSFTQGENGAFSQSFSFSFQFKMPGENSYTPVTTQPAPEPTPAATEKPPAPAIIGPEVPLATTSPVTDPVDDPVADPVIAPSGQDDPATATPAENETPLSFDERVAQLITYYRIDVSVTTASAATPVASEQVNAESVENEDAIATEAAPKEAAEETGRPDGLLLGIDADRVRRIRTGPGDDIVAILAERASRVSSGRGDDSLLINADKVRRINSGAGDDLIAIAASKATRIRSGEGDDTVYINADKVRRVNTGAGDDVLNIEADKVARIRTGEGDDAIMINADKIRRVHAGDGDDVMHLTADSISRINGGAGNDTIMLDAEDAGISFGKGGGNDVVDIKSVGALAINIDPALAASAEDMSIVHDAGGVRLEFSSGESLTLNNIENADMVSVRIGEDTVNLQLSEPSIELDMSA